jgi:ribonuclease HI
MNYSDNHCEVDRNLYALSIHFDGGARPNPGTGCCGGVIRRRIVGTLENRGDSCPVKHFNHYNESPLSDDDVVERFDYNVRLGDSHCTNNEAEYMSLILAMFFTLDRFHKRCPQCHHYEQRYESIDIYGDSKLVIQQMAGLWQIRCDRLHSLHDDATYFLKELSKSYSGCDYCTATVRFHHVPRNSNVEADALANQAISNPDPTVLFHDWPTDHLLHLIHEITCTTCIKRAHAEAEAASTAVPGSKSRLSRNRGNRRGRR